MDMTHKATLMAIRQMKSMPMLSLNSYPVIPVKKKEDSSGMNIILETCKLSNLTLYYLGIDIIKGKTAEQQAPKASVPTVAIK